MVGARANFMKMTRLTLHCSSSVGDPANRPSRLKDTRVASFQ